MFYERRDCSIPSKTKFKANRLRVKNYSQKLKIHSTTFALPLKKTYSQKEYVSGVPAIYESKLRHAK